MNVSIMNLNKVKSQKSKNVHKSRRRRRRRKFEPKTKNKGIRTNSTHTQANTPTTSFNATDNLSIHFFLNFCAFFLSSSGGDTPYTGPDRARAIDLFSLMVMVVPSVQDSRWEGGGNP